MAVAALITWLVTAVFGFTMLGIWLARGGLRRADAAGAAGGSNFAPPVVFGHFLLAAAGLVLWIVYLFVDRPALAWIAFVDLVVVAVLGDLLVLRWARDRRTVTHTGPGPTVAEARLAEQRFPLPVVVTHGVFAVATVVLVLLTALGVGGD